jgi:hypothetical protein
MGIVFLLLLLAQFEPEPRFGVSVLQEQQLAGTISSTPKPTSPQRGSGRPIPPLASKIQVATTNEGSRAQGDLTPRVFDALDGYCAICPEFFTSFVNSDSPALQIDL